VLLTGHVAVAPGGSARAHLFRLTALVVGCFSLVSIAGSGAVAGVSLAGTIVSGSFSSAAGQLSYDVYLPPGYATSGLRYPTIYYLHGLPATASSYESFGYVPKALEEDEIPAIVVAPQGAVSGEPDPEYRDLGAGEDWDTAIGVELPRVIDADFRTLPDRSGRAIIGVSAGGYGAMILGLHHLGLYSVIESWSGYFHPTDPTGTKSVDPRPWLSAHSFVPSLRRAFAVHPTFLGFYVGVSDSRFRQENIELARQLSQADVPFDFRMYPGGHSQSLWSVEAPLWLRLASAQLAPPS
jgi:S-formylglutathione hydrolase FrmB